VFTLISNLNFLFPTSIKAATTPNIFPWRKPLLFLYHCFPCSKHNEDTTFAMLRPLSPLFQFLWGLL
jgi:hypothetical protein